jgi:nucleotide-binding universal stress UspA family protein
MSIFPHIACCIDGRPGSRPVLAEARRLHRAGSGRLSVVHVAELDLAPLTLAGAAIATPPIEDPVPRAEALLRAIVESDQREYPVLLEGDGPAQVVCRWAAGAACPDLLVVGSYRTALARTLHGSFAGYLAYHAPCAVLVVRPRRAA